MTGQAVKFATGMNTVGTSARDNLTLLSDAMAVFKNLEHAEFAAPIMAKDEISLMKRCSARRVASTPRSSWTCSR
ncbi:hypothetical protein ACFS07_10460 [Undibacterium arcticum]